MSDPFRRSAVFVLLLLTALTAPALALPPSDLRADLALLRRATTALHPGLHRYNSPRGIDSLFAALDSTWSRERTLAEAYRDLSLLLARFRCGHSYANFFNQSDAVAEALFHGTNRLPFWFRWIDRRMIVTRDFTPDGRLPRGSEIVSIDGTPAGAILDRLVTVARSDGSNDAKRIAYLEVGGGTRYEAFDIYYPLFYPMSGADYRLAVHRPAAAAVTEVHVAPLSFQERAAAVLPGEVTRGDSVPVFEFRFLEPAVGYLRMPTWALYNSRWDWASWLGGVFSALDAARGTDLIVDLRGNEGGLDVGDAILAHRIDADLRLAGYERRARYRRVPEDLVPHLKTWDRSFFDWGPDAVEAGDGFYRLRDDAGSEAGRLIRAAAPRFRGRMWVLIDATNSSATFQFADAVRRHGLGTLVGEPTGGNQRGINGGAFFFLELPRTGIEVDIPLIAGFPTEPRPDAGLEPDIAVTTRVEDLTNGVDTALEFVRRKIAADPGSAPR